MLKCETATFWMITPNDAFGGQGCVGSWTNHDMYQLSTQADKRSLPTLVISSFHVSCELGGFTNSNQNILLLMAEIQSRRFCCDDLQQELAIN